ncbi:hypothetical protein Tco_0232636 [Tanacetum coccineum]
MISHLTRKISRRFTTVYYTLPPNNTLSGLKQIKNDYDTNVMYDIAKVAGKIQLFVSHHQIDLSTVFDSNEGHWEAFAEMMKHVITNYTSDSEDNKREVTQNDYTFNQMVEWAEQEHFEDEETKLSCPKIDLSTKDNEGLEEFDLKDNGGICTQYDVMYYVKSFINLSIQEIRKSSGIDDEVVQDQRQRDDNDLQDERQDQPEEEEVELRRRKRARTEKSFGPDFVSFMVENEPMSYREAVTSSEWLNGMKPLKVK